MTSSSANTNTDVEALQAQFGLPGIAQITTGNGGLPCIRITSSSASGEIYLHGAHVTSWHPNGTEEAIFVSRNAQWANHEAIRGGVPLCAPWFRAKDDAPKAPKPQAPKPQAPKPQAPKHGVVRTKAWHLEAIASLAEGVRVTLSTTNDSESRQWWPYDFTMRLRATFGASLHMELDYTNQASEPVTIAEALHTYLAVGDVRQVSVSGLDGVRYLDNIDGNREKRQHGELHFTSETDNAYLDTTSDLVLTDPSLQRTFHLVKSGSQSTVTWNPREDGARRISDLGDDEWQYFACVEACNVLDCSVSVAPGETHTLSSAITCRRL